METRTEMLTLLCLVYFEVKYPNSFSMEKRAQHYQGRGCWLEVRDFLLLIGGGMIMDKCIHLQISPHNLWSTSLWNTNTVKTQFEVGLLQAEPVWTLRTVRTSGPAATCGSVRWSISSSWRDAALGQISSLWSDPASRVWYVNLRYPIRRYHEAIHKYWLISSSPARVLVWSLFVARLN